MCNTKNKDNKKFTFIKREELGECLLCTKKVFNDNLFVEKGREVFHFSCYNNKEEETE